MKRAPKTGSPVSHDERRNWKPADTFEEFMANCREGLETFSERRAAKLLGVSRADIQRWVFMASLPKDLFERLLTSHRQTGRRIGEKEMAAIALALQGRTRSHEVEHCPHCRGVIRVRLPWHKTTGKIVNEWLSESYTP